MFDPDHLFYLACRDAVRDRAIDPVEAGLLKHLAGILGVERARANSILRRVWGEVEAGEVPAGGPLDPRRFFRAACALASDWCSAVSRDAATCGNWPVLRRFRTCPWRRSPRQNW